jgi:hypothetical protein
MKEHPNQRRELLRHLSIEMTPREHGLTPYRVSYRRPESHPLPSLRDEGIWYQHPERIESAIVWAKDVLSISDVLTYHYQDSYSDVRIIPPVDK